MDYCATELREKETTPIDVIYIFNKFRTLRFCPLEEYDEEYVFAFLDKGLSTLYKERSAVNFDAANSN